MAAASVLGMISKKYPLKFGYLGVRKEVIALVILSLATQDLEPKFILAVFDLTESMYSNINMFSKSERLAIQPDCQLLNSKILEFGDSSKIDF